MKTIFTKGTSIKLMPFSKKTTALFLLLFTAVKMTHAQNCTINAGVNTTYCPGSPMTLFGNVAGLYRDATITWSQVSGPAVTIANPKSLTTSCGTATIGATYVFRLSSQCQDGTNIFNDVTYTVAAATPTPPAANAGATINAGCVQWGTSIALNATPATAGFTGTWSIVSGGQGTFSNVNSATATFTPVQDRAGNPDWVCKSNTNTYVLRWTLSSSAASACPSAVTKTSADVTINATLWNPVTAFADAPCSGNAATLYGSCPGSGTSAWSLVSGPAGYSFASVSSQNVSLSNLPNGAYTFRYSVTGPCVTGTFNLSLNINLAANGATTASDANAGAIQTTYCSSIPSTIQLGANTPSPSETGTWSQIAGAPVTFSNIHDPNSSVSGLTVAGGPYTFLWEITSSANCINSSTVTITTSVTVPVVPPINLSTNCGDPVIFNSNPLCPSTAHLIAFPNTTLPIQPTQGWYIEGYSLNTKPGRSTVALGYYAATVTPNAIGITSSVFPCRGLNIFYTWPGGALMQLQVSMSNDFIPGVYTGKFKFKNAFCTDLSFDVPFSYTFSHNPTTSNAGTDQNLACNVTQTNLAGNDPAAVLPFAGLGFWNQVSGPNTAVIADLYNRNTQISSLIPGTYRFVWIITGGDLCPSSQDTVVVRVSNAVPLAVTAGANQTVCFGSPVTLTANLVPAGNLAAMLTNTGSTGRWTQVSGPAGAVINSPDSISTNITGLISGSVYVFRYTATNLCGSTQANVSIITTAAQGPGVANAGVNSCLAANTATVNLSATAPALGTGSWSKLNGGDPGTITNPASNVTSVTGVSPNGVYGYIWTVSNGGCTPVRDTVYISNTGTLSPAVARADLDTCAAGGGNTFQLYATAPANGTGTWSQVSGPVGASYNPNIANPLVTVVSNGQYIFRWTVSNGVCTNNTDDVRINFYNNPGIAVTLTQDTTLCGNSNGQLTLRAATPASGAGSWSVVSNGPASITNPSSPVTTATLNPGQTHLRWTVIPSTAVCPGSVDDIIVNYTPPANAKNDTTVCNSLSVLLKSSNAGSGSGAWTVISPAVHPAITFTKVTDSTYLASAPAGFGTGAYTFRWTVTNAACPPGFDDKIVTFNTLTPNAFFDACGGVGFPISLNGSTVPPGATATWSIVSIPSSATPGTIASPSSAITSYSTPNVPGFYSFKYQFTNATCTNADYVQASIVSPVTANASALIYCDNAAGLNLFGSNPFPGMGQWSVVSQPAGSPPVVWTNQNSQNANVKGLTKGNYVFQYRIAGLTGVFCNNNNSGVAINSTCFILPVKLSYFKAAGISCKLNRVNWRSETEDNFRRYELEYSVDGNNFTLLSTINARGSASDYSYDHLLPYNKTFYRLKQIDIDGKYSYSAVVSVFNKDCNNQTLSLFPVPAERDLLALLQSETNQQAQLKVFDMTGKLVSSYSVKLIKGVNKLTVNIEKLAKGMYSLKIENDTLYAKSVFIKN